MGKKFILIERNGSVKKEQVKEKPKGNMMCFIDSNGDSIYVEG